MSLFVRNFSGTFENLQSTCPEEIFEEFFFLLEEKVFLERFWTLSDKLSEPERKLKSAFQRNNDVWEFVFTISIGNWGFCKKITVIVQSFFLRVYRNSLMKKNWFEKSIFSLNFFGFRANTLRPFVDKFSAGGQNCFLQVRRKILRKKINFLEKKYIFYCLFWTMTEEFWPSDYKTFGRYVKTAFYVSFGTFWGLIIDSEKKCSLANLSGNNIVYCGFATDCLARSLRSHHHPVSSKSAIYYIISGNSANNFRASDSKCSAGLSKLLSVCPQEHFKIGGTILRSYPKKDNKNAYIFFKIVLSPQKLPTVM